MVDTQSTITNLVQCELGLEYLNLISVEEVQWLASD